MAYMYSFSVKYLLLATLTTRIASADYTNFYFNSSNGCPGLGIGCTAPESMCAYDSVNDKYYCCSGSNYDICRAFAATCGGSDGGPSSSQQTCTSGSDSWCCLSANNERCTSRTGQVNVCVATQDNPIAAVPELLMNETFSSLSSADPSATSYSVDVNSLAARATASSTSSSSLQSTSTTTSPSATTTQSPAPDDSDSISGGAIAGIVVGCVVGLAAIAGLIWFLLRRRRSQKKSASEIPPAAFPLGHSAEKHDHPMGSPLPGTKTPAPQYQIAEMDGRREVSEVAGWDPHTGLLSNNEEPTELPAGPLGPRELQG
ncbi:hypothetical protein M409DRAFT_55953 [Zasmidium cellare ATCC 36951]|uniref:Mid2 domain-containing protein n=1 Tax=Zasmidium cellare ATCC 36951 TaxID=1080233 RepID=A0A6A6CDD1_ZASCE|nr:uncharacterized protein M409DRAFT_55953 [Zasmidium cellare ATCC 36951]KAF2165051.1 hypothetical protein M409DRAFT_55953 [Zasmidium cellare ATCC 36951]